MWIALELERALELEVLEECGASEVVGRGLKRGGSGGCIGGLSRRCGFG